MSKILARVELLPRERPQTRRQENKDDLVRAGILRWLALLYACRLELQRRRDARPSQSRQALYAEMCSERTWSELMHTQMRWKYIWSDDSSTVAEHDIGTLLQECHVCNEETDTCTRLSRPILAAAARVSSRELCHKAFFIAHGGSRKLLQSRSLQQPWDGWSSARSLVRELRPSDLYTTAYRPSKILRQAWLRFEARHGLAAARAKWWYSHKDKQPDPVKWKAPDNRHLTQAEVFAQLRRWPSTGPFLSKVLFQLLRPHVHHGWGVVRAASHKLPLAKQFSNTGPGTRRMLNLFMGLKAGLDFLESSMTKQSARFFSNLLLDATAAWRVALRDLLRDDKLRCCHDHFRTMQADDAIALGFRLCELSKLIRVSFTPVPQRREAERTLKRPAAAAAAPETAKRRRGA